MCKIIIEENINDIETTNDIYIKIFSGNNKDIEGEKILKIYFDDINSEGIQDKYPFNEDKGVKIINFLNKHYNKDLNIHIYSENNTNRSSAIAILISKYLNKYEIARKILLCPKYYPNKIVLKKIKKCLTKVK